MDWKAYELEIRDYFKQAYPDATILFDQKIIGRYSKVERQIDILIEQYVAGNRMRIIVDAKHYKSKVDLKDIDSFIGMAEDVSAEGAILITNKGYSAAAMNRAYYGSRQIELDILNFKELQFMQGEGAIPYAGNFAVIMPAPFGWVIDAKRREGMLAALYQRGLSFEEAARNHEFIYVNMWHFDSEASSLDQLIEFQERQVKEYNPGAQFFYEGSIVRKDGAYSRIRKIVYGHDSPLEYTGFIEFKGFCVFFVLFTPEQLSIKNKRKLLFLLENALPGHVERSN